MPWMRNTVKPPAANTTSTTSGIHKRLKIDKAVVTGRRLRFRGVFAGGSSGDECSETSRSDWADPSVGTLPWINTPNPFQHPPCFWPFAGCHRSGPLPLRPCANCDKSQSCCWVSYQVFCYPTGDVVALLGCSASRLRRSRAGATTLRAATPRNGHQHAGRADHHCARGDHAPGAVMALAGVPWASWRDRRRPTGRDHGRHRIDFRAP